jgi:hypothetical protein
MIYFHKEEYKNNVLKIYNQGSCCATIRLTSHNHNFPVYLVDKPFCQYTSCTDESLYEFLFKSSYLICGSYVFFQNEGELQMHKMSKPKEEKTVFMTALFYLKYVNILTLLYCFSKKKCNILIF